MVYSWMDASRTYRSRCSAVLRFRNLYNLSNLGSLRDNVITPIPDPLLKLRYSCIHWVEHLCQWLESCGAEEILPQEDLVYNFLVTSSSIGWNQPFFAETWEM
jgi:hypothetical protein